MNDRDTLSQRLRDVVAETGALITDHIEEMIESIVASVELQTQEERSDGETP